MMNESVAQTLRTIKRHIRTKYNLPNTIEISKYLESLFWKYVAKMRALEKEDVLEVRIPDMLKDYIIWID